MWSRTNNHAEQKYYLISRAWYKNPATRAFTVQNDVISLTATKSVAGSNPIAWEIGDQQIWILENTCVPKIKWMILFAQVSYFGNDAQNLNVCYTWT